MGEPKAFASLSSGLLARKGAARPAMRPQGFGQAGSGLEDLGWNDMGFEPPKPTDGAADETHDAFGAEIQPHPVRNPLAGLTPVGSPVHDQQAEIASLKAENELLKARLNDLGSLAAKVEALERLAASASAADKVVTASK